MARIQVPPYIDRTEVVDTTGRIGKICHEAPVGPNDKAALAYLLPSGAQVPHPHASRGWSNVSDQEWVYDQHRLEELQQSCPERLILCKNTVER